MTELNELYHFGIKGQRWGVRRFQNADGTLTSDGRKRYQAYKKDWKSYNKLNRHVAASQKHLKEEGIMVDRVRDKFLAENKKLEKVMRKSTGLFGLKGAEKAEAVAKAQLSMDRIGKDYTQAAGTYGVAKKILDQDTKALKRHVDGMIKAYGKGSINELQTETVKMGQNKLQKILQGAPKSIIFEKGRETEEFVKTGKTLADMPVIGNLYVSKYIAGRELDLMRSKVESAVSAAKRGGKDGKEPAFLSDRDYFQGVSSEPESAGKARVKEARDAYKEAREKYNNAEKNYDSISNKMLEASVDHDRLQKDLSALRKKYEKAKDKEEGYKILSEIVELNQRVKDSASKVDSLNKEFEKAKNSLQAAQTESIKTGQKLINVNSAPGNRRAAKKLAKAEKKAIKAANKIDKKAKKASDKRSSKPKKSSPKKTPNNTPKQKSTVKSKLLGAGVDIGANAIGAVAGPAIGYVVKKLIKKHEQKKRKEAWDNFWGIKHSATYRVVRSDELYHHGVKGQRWGVRRYQNSDGTLTAKGRARYYSAVNVNKAFQETKNRPNVIKAKNVARTAAVVTAGFGGLTAGAVTGNPIVLGATPAAYLTAGYLANKAYIQDIKDYNEKYIRGSFTDTKSADDLEKIAPIRRNELKIDKNTEFTRISTKAQEDGKSRLYACLSADKKEIDYYAKDWPKYLEKIKQDPNIKVYKNTYKVNSEIVAPSLEKRKEIAQAILTADKHMKTELGKAYAMDQMRLSTGALYAKKLSDIKKLYATKEARVNVDKYYNDMIAYTAHKDFSVINNSDNYKAFAASIPTSQKLMDAYAKELKKQGFNAVYDDNSNAKSAFIFFDQSMLKQLSSEELKHFWSAVLSNELYHVE